MEETSKVFKKDKEMKKGEEFFLSPSPRFQALDFIIYLQWWYVWLIIAPVHNAVYRTYVADSLVFSHFGSNM